LALLFAGGAVWLFLAAIPVFADGGPHVSTINNGTGGINADSCAGCHRAHTAQGPYLINAPDEEALCLTCHGAATAGATTDVMTGVQYALASGLRGTTQLGALRNGGFDQARLDTANAARLGYLRSATDVSFRPKVGVSGPQNVTSAHLDLDGGGGVVASGILWGNGANGSGVGATGVNLTCASCHNPHGNGQYRILNPIPEADGAGFDDTWVATIVSSATTGSITTASSHGLLPGDKVTIAGHAGSTPTINGSWTVAAVTSTTFMLTGVTITVGGTGGTVTRTGGVTVADSPVDPDGLASNGIENPTKNYTVIQTKGTQGTNTTYMLYARDVVNAAAAVPPSFNSIPGTYGPTGGDYMHRQVPWSPQVNNPACDPTVFPAPAACATADDAPNGRPASSTSGATAGQVAFNLQITQWCSACHTRYFADQNPNPGTLQGPPAGPVTITSSATSGVITTGSNHGLAVNDSVTITGHSNAALNGSWTVATAPSPTTFTLTGVTITVAGTGGTSTRTAQAIPPATASSWWFPRTGATGAGSSDSLYKYQHRTVPNRACTTCHVSHGSNAQMTGPFSVNQTMPNNSAKTFVVGTGPTAVTLGDSRLLKIDNRGTCQACHDPTGTIPAGTYVGPAPTPAVP